MDMTVESTLEKITATWHPDARISAVEPITPDASLRRYYRLQLQGAGVRTAVAMVFDSLASPESSANAAAVRSDEAYLGLSRFLAAHGVAVPRVFAASEEPPVILLEDVGNTLLSDVLLGDVMSSGRERLEELYKQAIAELLKLQQIEKVPDFFAFQRSFTAAPYYREMLEFRDYTLLPAGAAKEQVAAAERFFSALAERLEKLPLVLVHRDYHSWNLLIDAGGRVRVIDFQDALLGTRCYDVVGLLNDRDTDQALGDELYRKLLCFFYQGSGSPAWFAAEYDLVLLQRDLKVAGRFGKLSVERGLRQYEKWIPGTLRRIGRTLRRMCEEGREDALQKTFRSAVEELLPEVRHGGADYFRLELS